MAPRPTTTQSQVWTERAMVDLLQAARPQSLLSLEHGAEEARIGQG